MILTNDSELVEMDSLSERECGVGFDNIDTKLHPQFIASRTDRAELSPMTICGVQLK
jgi:hypothetical protein